MNRLTIDDRSFGGKVFRPRPEIYVSESADLILIATPWGARSSAKKVIERMLEYISLARDDKDTTSPFERLSCLSPMSNNLRIAAFLANDLLFRNDNQEEYRVGVELVALALSGDEIVWLQVGSPQIFVSRQNCPILCLGPSLDLSFDLGNGSEILPPLPSQMLGLDESVNLNTNSFKARPDDVLLLLAHSQPPASLYEIRIRDTQLDDITRNLSVSDAETPFWLAQVRLKSDSKYGDKD